MKKKKKLTHDEVSLLGGTTTKARHGRKHYVRMAKKRWRKHRRQAKNPGNEKL